MLPRCDLMHRRDSGIVGPATLAVTRVGRFLEKQGWHLALLVGLWLVAGAVAGGEGYQAGSLWGVSTPVWFWMSIVLPAVHQVWVVVCWRLELHGGWLSRHLGRYGFRLYAAGFAWLAFLRLSALTLLAVANEGTLAVSRPLLNTIAAVFAALVVYLMYSVTRYFTFRRALGIDHFDPSYRDKPLVHRGIFRFTSNGMYTFGLLVVWLPGLLAASKAALLSAAFSHIYIWVHYYCTERPDMRRIYGKGVR